MTFPNFSCVTKRGEIKGSRNAYNSRVVQPYKQPDVTQEPWGKLRVRRPGTYLQVGVWTGSCTCLGLDLSSISKTVTSLENRLVVGRGRLKGEGWIGSLDLHMQTIMY